ncbi:MAG: hypothetical protein P8Q48_24675 [Paracoccaceae bacterium]|nr:hypothetical protein [Paracoccaceae bacterium]
MLAVTVAPHLACNRSECPVSANGAFRCRCSIWKAIVDHADGNVGFVRDLPGSLQFGEWQELEFSPNMV